MVFCYPISMVKILYAEDNPDVRFGITTFLKCKGYEVISVPDGEEALKRIRDEGNSIDLLLTDVDMPVRDGYSLVNNLTSVNYGGPVIMISGSNFDKSKVEYKGKFYFVPKGDIRPISSKIESLVRK